MMTFQYSPYMWPFKQGEGFIRKPVIRCISSRLHSGGYTMHRPQSPAKMSMTPNAHRAVLIIDDDVNNIEILRLDLEDEGYAVLTATDGDEGWQVLQEHQERIAAILLDRMMPGTDGMAFMRRLKADASVAQKPVIMQTAAAEKSQVAEGIKAGVYYYLTKPYEAEVMRSLLRAAISDYGEYQRLREELQQHREKRHLICEATYEIQNLEDVRHLAAELAHYYPSPEQVIFGLSEMMVNAIEHGNLGIGYHEKSRMLKENRWEEAVSRRIAAPENADKRVRVQFRRDEDALLLTITDEGEGFNWEPYMNLVPARATDSHGRGIALSRMMSFDSIEYRGKGNEVLCKTSLL